MSNFLKKILFIFGERGREGDRAGEGRQAAASRTPQLGTWRTTQARALSGNHTGNLFRSQAGTQSAEPHQPVLSPVLY